MCNPILYLFCSVLGEREISLSSFRGLWKALLPQITSIKPRTDLCWQCHKNNYQLIRSVNLSDEKRAERHQEQIDHLALAQKERKLYQEMSAACKKICDEWQLSLAPSTPATKKLTMHYSFDFAQQVGRIIHPHFCLLTIHCVVHVLGC